MPVYFYAARHVVVEQEEKKNVSENKWTFLVVSNTLWLTFVKGMVVQQNTPLV